MKQLIAKKKILLFMMAFSCLTFAISLPATAKSVSTKQYTISHDSGTYDKKITVTVSPKKGYKVYYTTGSKFSANRLIKSGKKKKVVIKKNTTLALYYVKNSETLSKKKLKSIRLYKKCRHFVYRIQDKGGSGDDPSDPSGGGNNKPSDDPSKEEDDGQIKEDGVYTSKDDVALYLHTFGKLPKNFMTKEEARALGWNGGGLDPYKDGYCIGGDVFSNYQKILPEGKYHECDIDTLHKSVRGAKRLVYSDDGRIYYTEDHYDSFTQLY